MVQALATANTDLASHWLAKTQVWGAICNTLTLTDEQFLPFLSL